MSYTVDQVADHLDLALEAGLIDQGGSGVINGFMFRRLTWEGHDFVDAVRNDDIWKRHAKEPMQPAVSASICSKI